MRPDDHRSRDDTAEENDLAAMADALEHVPRGAIALAGAAVILMMIGWFGIYLLEFLPRGSVG